MDLVATRDKVVEIARHAGDVLMRYFDQPHETYSKQNIFDIVTDADKASEH